MNVVKGLLCVNKTAVTTMVLTYVAAKKGSHLKVMDTLVLVRSVLL